MKTFTLENTKEIFNILEFCKEIKQDPKWHPEGTVFNHSLQALKWAFRESDDIDLILAAMLHDIGKSVNSHGHEKIGCELLNNYVSVKMNPLTGIANRKVYYR